MNRYNNYHKHSHYSNIFGGVDSCVKPIHYIERILELGEQNYFTTEHGFGGDIFEGRTLCDNNNLHCKFGVEAYIVPNRSLKDDSNYHIMLIPKNNEAREKLNLCTSAGNVHGYYRKPRIEVNDLLDNFDNDLYITTACVAGCLRNKNGIDNIFLPLYEKFGNNIFLEVQSHIDDTQIMINNRCLEFSKEYGLSIIAANDSHYIYPYQKEEREKFLKGKGINYGVEDTYLLDYPSYEEMCENIGIPKDKKYVVVTFHPVTLEDESASEQVDALIEAMRQKDDYFYLITKANADVGGELVNARFEAYCQNRRGRHPCQRGLTKAERK